MNPLPILVLGYSGSGKSTSIRKLNPEETFLINCLGKALPFKGGNKFYTELNKSNNPDGNMLTTDDYTIIKNAINYIDKERANITNIIIDDSQALIINEFMRRHSTQGKGKDVFQLYNEIADHFWNLIIDLKFLRNNLFIFFLHHSELNEAGRIEPKTIGKLLNEKVGIPSMFTIVLYAMRESEHNFFVTQNDGTSPAKSPEGMFNTIKIDNNLQLVRDAATLYYQGE